MAQQSLFSLLPWLLNAGAHAWGVDLWYHQKEPFPNNLMGRAMEAYQKEFGARLIRGDALALKMKTDSVDVVVSNKLINNFEMPQKLKFLEEVLRVLKPGGEARVDFVTHHEAVVIFDALNERFPKAKIFEFNEEGMAGSAGSLPEAGFQIIRDDASGVLTILKRKPFKDL